MVSFPYYVPLIYSEIISTFVPIKDKINLTLVLASFIYVFVD